MNVLNLISWVDSGHCLVISFALSDDCRTIEFLPETHGMFLENHMIRSMTVERITACEAECFQEPNCVSFNYGPINSHKPKCNLNNRTHLQASVGDFVAKDNYIYRYIAVSSQNYWFELTLLCLNFN